MNVQTVIRDTTPLSYFETYGNVLKFQTLLVGDHGWKLQNSCQNSKQGRP